MSGSVLVPILLAAAMVILTVSVILLILLIVDGPQMAALFGGWF